MAENLEVPLSYRNVRAAERSALVADTLDRFQMVAKKDLYPRGSSRAGSRSWSRWPGP